MAQLRERKKAATRQAISDVATRLFEQQGFEQVTLAEIATAADVSVKTVLNYFGSKEELFFDAEEAILDGLLATLRDREPDVSPVAALRPLFLKGPMLHDACSWSQLDDERCERIRSFLACERRSPALSARRLLITDAWAAPLAREVGSEAWAAMLVGIVNLRQRVIADALLEGCSPRTVARRVRTTVGGALDGLERSSLTSASRSPNARTAPSSPA